MDEEKNEIVKRRVMSLLAGVAGGFFMATVILLLVNTFHVYNVVSLTFVLLLCIGSVLPWCLDFLQERGFYILISEVVTIVVSVVICLLYVGTVSRNDTARTSLNQVIVLLHGCSLLVTLAHLWLRHRKETV